MRRHKKRDILTKGEVEYILTKLTDPAMKACVTILYWTGGRISEVLALKIYNVYNEDNTIFIDIPSLKQEKGKRDEYIRRRTLQFNSEILPFIEHFIPFMRLQYDTRDENEKIFTFGKRWVEMKLKEISDKCPERCGGQIWCHLFRRTRLQNMADKGATAHQIKAFAGHKDIKSSDAYIQRSTKQLEALRNMVD